MNSRKLVVLAFALTLSAACRKQYEFSWESDGSVMDSATDAQEDASVDSPVAVDRADVGVTPADVRDVVDGSTLDLGAPRPIAPLSTSTVTSLHPTLHWALAPGTDGARVQICHDRACNTEVTHFDVTGTYGAPSTNLPSGVLFWRLYPSHGGQVGTARSPTWQFNVGVLNAPHDSSWGTTLDLNGDGYADVAVGASGAASSTGRVYVFPGGTSGTSTTPSVTLTGPDGANGQFGYSVASAGDVNGDGFADLVIGAPAVMSSTGRVYVYFGSASGVATNPSVTLTGMTNAHFGTSVASAGDVNGDGFADVIVGAPGSPSVTNGSPSVFLGSANGTAMSPVTTFTQLPASGQVFGSPVAGAGDVNADGFADVIVGSPTAASGNGRAYLYLGGTSGPSTMPQITLLGLEAFARLGVSVACTGDVNGDGYSDVVVGAGGDTHAGTAFVFVGSTSGTVTTPIASLPGPDGVNGFFAEAVSGAGDINGDGYSDTVVGAYDVMTVGRAYLYLGGAGGTSTTPRATLTGTDANGNFGGAVSSPGDVNGDGYADIVVGAWNATQSTGDAFVFEGTSNGMLTAPSFTLTALDGVSGDSFGFSVASNERWHSVPIILRTRQPFFLADGS